MSETIGVRELKNHASKIVRAVREELAEYIITVHGEPVAVLRPITPADTEKLQYEQTEQALQALDALSRKIGATWQSEKTGQALLDEMRDA